MADNDKNLSADFQARAEAYSSGQTIFLIDGSGSMPMSYGAGNPIDTAVSYARQVKEQLSPETLAFFFGPSNQKCIHIDLDEGADPMSRFPGSEGNLLPAFTAIADSYGKGVFEKKLHIVIVSDGGISELFSKEGKEKTRETLTTFLRSNPDVMLDIIVPGKAFSDFAEFLKTMMPAGDPQAPCIYTASDPANLPIIMAKALNTRTGAQGVLDAAAHEAVNGVRQPVKAMSTLKLKKPVVE